MSRTKTIISGASGWLGKVLISELISGGHSPYDLKLISSHSKTIDTNNFKLKSETFETASNLIDADIYFDFAFLTRDKIMEIGANKFVEINKEIIQKSVDLIASTNPRAIVLSSSGAIYKKGLNDHKDLNHLYSELKIYQEEKISEVCSKIGANLVICRIFNLSGNGMGNSGTYILSELIEKSLQNLDISIESSFKVYRRYCDISQLIRLLITLGELQKDLILDTGGELIEIRELAKLVIECLGSSSKLRFSEVLDDKSSDFYFSESNQYEQLLKDLTKQDSLTIKEQIYNTKTFIDTNKY
jgi:nucleoside-diphosphate-sugar epimerase